MVAVRLGLDPTAPQAKADPPPKPNRARAVAAKPVTRVVVTKRSFLGAGTEVKPGERHFTDYVFPPNYSPYSVVDPTRSYRYPLPDPFWLPGCCNSLGY